MRDYFNTAKPAKLIAGAIAIMMFISIFDASTFAYAKDLSPEDRAKEIAEQEAKENANREKREREEKIAEETVDDQIERENRNPGKASFLKATTSVKTDSISDSKVKKGYRIVNLSWKGTENADSYQVYYCYSKDGTYKKKGEPVKATKNRGMLFKNNREVFLKVMTLNGENEGKLSSWVVIWPGYGKQVNATKIEIESGPNVLFAGFASKYKDSSDASMENTYKTKWSSTNPEVATITKTTGKVTALKKGTTVIKARTHAGWRVEKKLTVRVTTPSKVPNVKGLTKAQAKKVMKKAGFKVKTQRKFVKKSTMKKSYNNAAFGTVISQSKKSGRTLQKGSTVKLVWAEKLYYYGKGVKAMVKWAEAVARDNSYGYSMGVYTGRGLDRLCPYTNKGASKDYDCATFVNAALAFSGMGKDFMKATHKPSPVVGGVKALMVKNGWKKVLIKRSYWKNGKKKYYYTKPMVSELKRGDILVNTACHIQIHVGNGKDVGAHNNYDGRSGDSSGREISIAPSWTGYAEVFRYKGNIGK